MVEFTTREFTRVKIHNDKNLYKINISFYLFIYLLALHVKKKSRHVKIFKLQRKLNS